MGQWRQLGEVRKIELDSCCVQRGLCQPPALLDLLVQESTCQPPALQQVSPWLAGRQVHQRPQRNHTCFAAETHTPPQTWYKVIHNTSCAVKHYSPHLRVSWSLSIKGATNAHQFPHRKGCDADLLSPLPHTPLTSGGWHAALCGRHTWCLLEADCPPWPTLVGGSSWTAA